MARLSELSHNILSFELVFVLFLFSGVYKQSPGINSILPVDTAVLFGVICICSFLYILFSSETQQNRVVVVSTFLFAMFIAYALLSLTWSELSSYALGKALRVSTILPFVFLSGVLIIGSSKVRMRRFTWVVVLLGAVVSMEQLGIYLSGDSLLSTPPFNASSYQLSSYLLGFALVSSIMLFDIVNKRWEKLTLAGVIAAFIICVLIGGARGAVIASVVAASVFCLQYLSFEKNMRIIKVPSSVGHIAAGVGGVSVLVAALMVQNLDVATLKRFSLLFQGGGESVNNRIILYQAAISQFYSNPIVGVGLGDYAEMASVPNSYPHNIVLEVGAELGTVGLFLFSFMFIYPIYIWWHRDASSYHFYSMAIFCYFLVFSSLSGDLSSARFLFFGLSTLLFSDPD